MRLLILTQRVDINDALCGFFHDWLVEFSKHCEKVIVICLEQGEYNLPENVRVISLGKEKILEWQPRAVKRLIYLTNFYASIWRERKNYDQVFVHMNHEYVVLGGLLWRLLRKKIGLWYVHKQVSFTLRLAEKLVNTVFSVTKDGFRINSKKLRVVGHGIDTGKFQITNNKYQINSKSPLDETRGRQIPNDTFTILYVGRVSRIKNQKLLIEAIDILHRDADSSRLKVQLVGGAVYKDDKVYEEELNRIVKEKELGGIVEFVGSVPNTEILKYYLGADLSVNLCPTGGADKAVIESMACGLPIVVLNKAFAPDLGEYEEDLLLSEAAARVLAGKLKTMIEMQAGDREKIGQALRKRAEDTHSLEGLIKKIVSQL